MITLFPLTFAAANALVIKWHRHHDPVQGYHFAIGAKLDGEVVGGVIVGRPVAAALDDGHVREVTRMSNRGGDDNVGSKLLGAVGRCCDAMGVRLLVSYTRVDEPGTVYRAAGWIPVATVKGKGWTGGNKALRWLPGFYEPSTEIVDRTRWERRPTEHVQAVVKMISALGRFAASCMKRTRRAA